MGKQLLVEGRRKVGFFGGNHKRRETGNANASEVPKHTVLWQIYIKQFIGGNI